MTKADKEGQRKAPILRFKGFTDAWEQRKLGEIGKIRSCKRIYRNQTSSKGEIPFYKIGTFGKEADSFISRKLYEEYKERFSFPQVGDILISASGTLGRTVVYNGENAYFQDSNIVWIDNDNHLALNKYLEIYYQRIHWKASEGSTIKRLYNSDIERTIISIPKRDEQARLSKCLKLLNKVITLYERKLQLNLKLYAELLNQFIPDKNSKSILNKINWQSISLGKIAHLQKGKQKNRNDISEVRNDKETYPVYNGGKEKSGYTDEYNRNDSIIISEGGNSAGYVNYIAGKFYSGGHNYSIEPQNIDSSLLYLILLRNQSRIMNLRTGSGLPNIKISSLKSFKIFIPSKNDNLYDFDKLLILLTKDNNLIKDKLNKLKLIKKTLLNTMFI